MIIVETIHGSHLYGTDTSSSDQDFKRIIIPSAEDILLGTKHSSREMTKKVGTDKNTAGDRDVDIWSLQHFFEMVGEAQPQAMEVLFTPPSFRLGWGSEWEHIYVHRDRLLSRKVQAYLEYCMQQAAKYGIKGSRVHAMELAATFFGAKKNEHPSGAKVRDVLDEFEDRLAGVEHIKVVPVPQPGSGGTQKTILHIDVCGAMVPVTFTLKETHAIFQRCWEAYGERARKAQANDGVDWKALSHALRVGYQAVELLITGDLIFPRPEHEYLLATKLGERPYNEVAAELEELIPKMQAAHAASRLPDEPDHEWINQELLFYYGREVSRAWTHGTLSTPHKDGSLSRSGTEWIPF